MLTCLLLFNWVGYQLVLNYLQLDADRQLEARIDKEHYNESQLIEIKLALNLPYQSSWAEYERYYGEIEIDGMQYTYVKRKIEDGYLVLKCIPNHQKELIKNTGNNLFRALNGLDQEKGKNASPFAKLVKCLGADFDNDNINLHFATVQYAGNTHLLTNSRFIKQGFTTICEQPPDYSVFA